MNRLYLCLLFSLLSPLAQAAEPAGDTSADGIEVESVVITLIEQVEVPAQESGVLAAISGEGQQVVQGQTIAQISDTQAQLTLKRAEVELENARTQAGSRISIRYAEKSREVADAEVQRATDSLERYPRSISATEIARLRLSAEKAALAVEQANFEFELAQFAARLREAERELAAENVKRRQITSPLDGVVVEVNRREGEWIEASKTVFRIVRMDRLRAEGFLHADQVAEDLVGRDIVLKTALSGGKPMEFTGKLVFVSPEISPVNGQLRIWAEIENPDLKLRPGLRGSMRIVAGAESRQNKRRTEKWGDRNRGQKNEEERAQLHVLLCALFLPPLFLSAPKISDRDPVEQRASEPFGCVLDMLRESTCVALFAAAKTLSNRAEQRRRQAV